MECYLYTAIYLAIGFAYFKFYLEGRFLLNPCGIFMLANFVSAVGIFFLLDSSEASDMTHALILLGSFTCFCFGSILGQSLVPVNKDRINFWWFQRPLIRHRGTLFFMLLGSIVAVSVPLVLFYFRSIGYNLFLEMLRGSSSTVLGGDTRVSSLRLDSYSGDKYLAPGYINQFKNILFPLLVFYAFVISILMKAKNGWLVNLVLAGLALLAIAGLLGTGQRGAFFTILLITLLSIYCLSPQQSFLRYALVVALRPKYILGVVFAIGLLAFVSINLKRGDSIENLSFADKSLAVGGRMLERLLVVNQKASVISFRYLDQQPIAYGAQWLESIKGVLPSHRGSNLDNILFSLRWGSTKGNSPPSIYGSMYHNFGTIGTLVITFLLGFSYHCIYSALFKFNKSVLVLIIFSALTIIVGRWTEGTPLALLNRGAVTVSLLLALVVFTPKEDVQV